MGTPFDPDRWYRTERTLLETRRESRALDDARYLEALADLDWRYDEIVARIDRTTRAPRRGDLGTHRGGL